VSLARSYSFGAFLLSEGVLYRDGQRVALTPKVVETLEALVAGDGRLVSKNDLMKSVWPDTFVDESSLTSNISILRKTLGTHPDGQPYIQTIPKRGYRFLAPLVPSKGLASVPRVEASFPQPIPWKPGIEVDALSSKKHTSWRSAVLLVLLAIAGSAFFLFRHLGSSRPPQSMRMLLVLPFQNLTGDPAQEYVSDGFTEEMITQLSTLPHDQIAVVARTSSMTYKGTSKNIAQIGRELGVDYVLEGSVRRWGDRVRISAQLIWTRDQTHLWASNYDRDRQDILKMQSEVARSISQQIRLTLSPIQLGRFENVSTVDPQAYELCLRGRYEWNKRTEASLNKAIAFFQQAIDRDPSYASAYAGLAQSYIVAVYYGKAEPDNDLFRKAKIAAQRALALDDGLVEAHTALGLIESQEDPAQAVREYQRAFELNPNYPTAHHWYSFLLRKSGHRAEALAEIERARRLDPLSMIIIVDEARMLYEMRQFERAIEQLEKAIELDANFAEAHRILALCYAQKKRYIEALAEAKKGFDLDPNDSQRGTLGYLYGVTGQHEAAKAAALTLGKSANVNAVAQNNLCYVLMGLAETDQTLKCLEDGARAHTLGAIDIRTEPVFDPLAQNPRLQVLLRRLER
jgi:TolB-like protein/DNA-binding winged helix-turn-helix (wHTH) protein/tetratricopeptide (TPR) repeat protein